MTLGQFRSITSGMPDSTDMVIMGTQDAEIYAIEDVSVNREANIIDLEINNI